MPKSQGQGSPTFRKVALELARGLWRLLKPCLEAVDEALAQALWRLFCSLTTELSEHEARQILRATQRKRVKRQRSCISSAPIGLNRPPRSPRGR